MVILSLLIIQNACFAFGKKKWENVLSCILAQGQLREDQAKILSTILVVVFFVSLIKKKERTREK